MIDDPQRFRHGWELCTQFIQAGNKHPAAGLNGFVAGLYYLCRLVVLDRE